MSDPSARDRFVEAMRGIMGATHTRVPPGEKHGCTICRDARRAVEAFADAECCYGTGDRRHAACRAALLKDCNL